MQILGIETSCDETAVAVVRDGTTLLSNVVATSLDIHVKYGGVVPDKAAREQLQSILPVLNEALLPLGSTPFDEIDAIAVTSGPGLIGSLLIGVETAKALAFATGKPLIPVNHLVGHIYANWLTSGTPKLDYHKTPPSFPALVLLASGNHSDIVLMKDHGQFDYLGSTKDDAAGECFDKCGRLLELPYPYGPFIEKLAAQHDPHSSRFKFHLPRPLAGSRDFDYSFSGLKTAFRNQFQEQVKKNSLSGECKTALAYELQEAITDVLIKKITRAAAAFKVKSLVLCGGVAANQRLREKFFALGSSLEIPAFIPAFKLCTDNAVYIASAAFFNQNPTPWETVNANPALSITSLVST